MDFFRDLGHTILGKWRQFDFDGRAFPEIAAAALQERSPAANVTAMEVVRWVHETEALVPQAEIDSEFGQPPITVFSCERFYIDVLFWVDGSTAIHEHCFSGAFQVMDGRSIQSTYCFTPSRRYCDQLLSGKLELLAVELLRAGDVRPIRAGSGFVHALFHIDRPSVSVVVRTGIDAFTGPQYEYSRSGLAADPFARSESVARKIQTLDMLHEVDHPQFEPMAIAAVLRADSFVAFRILKHLMKRISHQKYLNFLESIRPSHAGLIDSLKSDAAEQTRVKHIALCLRRSKRPEHRFFLGLLLCVPDRSRLLDLVHQGFPDQQPIKTVVGWLADLARIDAIHLWMDDVSKVRSEGGEASRILDVALDEAALKIIEDMLGGVPDESVVQRFQVPSGTVHCRPSEVLDRCGELRRSLLLRPLFTP